MYYLSMIQWSIQELACVCPSPVFPEKENPIYVSNWKKAETLFAYTVHFKFSELIRSLPSKTFQVQNLNKKVCERILIRFPLINTHSFKKNYFPLVCLVKRGKLELL